MKFQRRRCSSCNQKACKYHSSNLSEEDLKNYNILNTLNDISKYGCECYCEVTMDKIHLKRCETCNNKQCDFHMSHENLEYMNSPITHIIRTHTSFKGCASHVGEE